MVVCHSLSQSVVVYRCSVVIWSAFEGGQVSHFSIFVLCSRKEATLDNLLEHDTSTFCATFGIQGHCGFLRRTGRIAAEGADSESFTAWSATVRVARVPWLSICLSRFLVFCTCELSALVWCLPPIGHFDIYIFCTFCHGRFAWKPNALHDPCIHHRSSLKGEEGADHSREGCRAVWQPSNAITCTSSNMIQHRRKEKAERVLEPVTTQDRYDTIKQRCHDSSIPTAGFAWESFWNPKSQSHQKLTKLWGKMSWTRSHRQPTGADKMGHFVRSCTKQKMERDVSCFGLRENAKQCCFQMCCCSEAGMPKQWENLFCFETCQLNDLGGNYCLLF